MYLKENVSDVLQMDHSCLTLSKTDQLKLFFEDILLVVDEHDILSNWERSTSLLESVDEIVGLFRLKIYCRDWRETDMQSLIWKSKIIRMTEQLLCLDNRLKYKP